MTAMSQSSVAVTANGADYALLNASPDLRGQIIAAPALHPRDGLRHSPIKSVLVTNGDLDHIAGLLTLREKQEFRLYATAQIHEILAANPVFSALDPDFVRRRTIALEESFELAPGLVATLFPTPGKTPLFLEGDGPVATDVEGEQTVGVALEAAGKRALYIPGCARVTPALKARIETAQTLLFDGTVFHDDEMVREGVGAKTGARMGHIAMAGADGSLAALRDVADVRKIYIHINNTNPVLRPGSQERAEVLAAGWELAQDGMEIRL